MEYCFLGCFAVQHSYEKSSDTSDCHTYSRSLDNVIGNCFLNSGRSWHIPYTLSLLTPLSVGSATIILHVILILLQILILRKQYKPVQLLQLPLAIAFGLLTDLSNAMLCTLVPSNYAVSWFYCLIGILLVATGVSAEVLSGTIPLAAEGLSLALQEATGRKFSTMKVCVDCSLVALSLLLSFLFLKNWGGVREGTIAAALLVGTVSKAFTRLLSPVRKWVSN